MLPPSKHYPLYDFDLRATHARKLLPAALASVSFGFVLVRVRGSLWVSKMERASQRLHGTTSSENTHAYEAAYHHQKY